MAGENNNGGGIADGEFKPSSEFFDSFKTTVIEEPEFTPAPIKSQAEIDAEASAAAASKGAQNDDPNNKGLSPEDKQKKEAAEKLAEEQKVAAMKPEEREAYLKSKEKPNDAPPPPVKTFDQEFEERFGGKKYEDVKAALEAEKEEEVFANDQIKFFNELAKSGVEINADYIATITKNYEAMENPLEILAEQIRQENPTMDEDEIEFEIRTKYRMDEWAAEGEEPTDIEKIMAKKQLREANETREKLIEKRNSLSFIKPKDPIAEQKIAKDRLEVQQKFEAKLDNEIVPKVQKLSTKFTDKDGAEHVVDFEIDNSARGKVVPLMKAMGSNAGVFFTQYSGADGKFDHAKFLQHQLILENHDKIVRKSYEQGLSLGEERVAKGIKGIDFENRGKPEGTPVAKSLDQSIAESLNKNF